MNNEESHKIAREVRFANLGRQLADSAMRGAATGELLSELAIIRTAEHRVSDRVVAFAGLARQIGDAVQAGRDITDLLERLIALRRFECTGRAMTDQQ